MPDIFSIYLGRHKNDRTAVLQNLLVNNVLSDENGPHFYNAVNRILQERNANNPDYAEQAPVVAAPAPPPAAPAPGAVAATAPPPAAPAPGAVAATAPPPAVEAPAPTPYDDEVRKAQQHLNEMKLAMYRKPNLTTTWLTHVINDSRAHHRGPAGLQEVINQWPAGSSAPGSEYADVARMLLAEHALEQARTQQRLHALPPARQETERVLDSAIQHLTNQTPQAGSKESGERIVQLRALQSQSQIPRGVSSVPTPLENASAAIAQRNARSVLPPSDFSYQAAPSGSAQAAVEKVAEHYAPQFQGSPEVAAQQRAAAQERAAAPLDQAAAGASAQELLAQAEEYKKKLDQLERQRNSQFLTQQEQPYQQDFSAADLMQYARAYHDYQGQNPIQQGQLHPRLEMLMNHLQAIRGQQAQPQTQYVPIRPKMPFHQRVEQFFDPSFLNPDEYPEEP